MQTRITNNLNTYLETLDARLAEALGELWNGFSPEVRTTIHTVFTQSVEDVIAMARQGKSIHERFVHNVVMNAVDSIVGVYPDGSIFFWNKGAEENFGYTSEEMTGRPFARLVPEDLLESGELAQLDEQTVRDGFIRNHQTRRLTKDGRILFVSLSRTVVLDQEGNNLGSVVILRDMTEMKLLEAQVFQNEKLALVGQVASGVAHEIGTPLNVISGIAEYLMMDRDEKDPDLGDFQSILDQTHRISTLVKDLLAFARPQPVERRLLELNQEVGSVVALLRGKFSKDKIKLIIDLEDNIPPVSADRNQIQQVFLNILMNAYDSLSSVDAADKQIRIATERLNGDGSARVKVEISDNGPGLPVEVIARIFEPFYTTKAVGKGTGLGLAITKRIIDLHGGYIEAGNAADHGAVFTIILPA